MRKILLSFLLAGFMVSQLFAEGYQVNLQGTKQVGMGHAGTSMAFGSSSIHFNPGSLPFMTGKYSFEGGVHLLRSFNTYEANAPERYSAHTENPLGTPLYLYAAGKITDKLVAGIGITTPYGNSLKWEDGWKGRYLIKDITMKAFIIQPTVAFKIMDQVSIGAGFMYAISSVELSKALPFEDATSEGSVTLKGKTTSMGANIGVHIRPMEKLNIGISYRTKMTNKLKDGDATFKTPGILSIYFPASNKFDAELPFPSNLNIGASYMATDKLTVAVDVNYVGWSAYDSLCFDFKTNTVNLADSRNPRKWENTLIYRLGGQYMVNEKITVRAGAYFDNTPIQDDLLSPETPGADKIGLSCGASFVPIKNLSVDVSLLHIRALERKAGYITPDATLEGTYNSRAYIFGLGVSYQF